MVDCSNLILELRRKIGFVDQFPSFQRIFNRFSKVEPDIVKRIKKLSNNYPLNGYGKALKKHKSASDLIRNYLAKWKKC